MRGLWGKNKTHVLVLKKLKKGEQQMPIHVRRHGRREIEFCHCCEPVRAAREDRKEFTRVGLGIFGIE